MSTTSSSDCRSYPAPKTTLKLVVDTKAGRVLYAEAGKRVADLIVSISALPLNIVAGLLKHGTGGCDLVHELDGAKEAVHSTAFGRILIDAVYSGTGVSDHDAVKAFTVADNLKVKPKLLPSASLLETMGVKDLGAIQEKTVHLGNDQVVEIVRVVQRCNTVLTDVFLHAPAAAADKKKKKRKRSRRRSTSASKRVVE